MVIDPFRERSETCSAKKVSTGIGHMAVNSSRRAHTEGYASVHAKRTLQEGVRRLLATESDAEELCGKLRPRREWPLGILAGGNR